MLFTFCNPPSAINLLILIVITDGMECQLVLAFLFIDKSSNGIADTCGMCIVHEIHYLLTILMKRSLGCSKSLVLRYHIIHRRDVQAKFVAKIAFINAL